MASSVGKLNNFVALNEKFGYIGYVCMYVFRMSKRHIKCYENSRSYQRQDFAGLFYSKDFGKLQDKGKKKSHALAKHQAIMILKYRCA